MLVMKLTREFDAEQYVKATQAWQWLDLGGKTPLFASLFGDVFFRASGGFWWLDTLEGSLTRPWPTAAQMQAELNTPATVDAQPVEQVPALAGLDADQAGHRHSARALARHPHHRGVSPTDPGTRLGRAQVLPGL